MARNYGDDNKSALQAKSDAQKIAFAPIMFQAAKALRDFRILSYLRRNKEGGTLEEIAKHAGISEYGTLVLLEAGLSMEMVMVKKDKYYLTKTGYFLNVDMLTRVNLDFTHDVNYKGFFHLQEAITEGSPAGLNNEFGPWPTVYEALAELPEKFRKSWFGFDHYYSDTSFPQVMPVIFRNNPKRILDVGGNTGKFAIKCAEYNESVLVSILDLPGQLKDAEKNIHENLRSPTQTIQGGYISEPIFFDQRVQFNDYYICGFYEYSIDDDLWINENHFYVDLYYDDTKFTDEAINYINIFNSTNSRFKT